MFAIKGTPEAVLDMLEKTCEQVVRSDGYRVRLEKLNQTPNSEGRAEFARKLRADNEFKARLVKALGLKVQ